MFSLYFSCDGTIEIFHYNGTKRNTVEDLRMLKLKGKWYKNLTRKALKQNREVLMVSSEGTCCWQIFSKIYFAGRQQVIPTGFAGRPNFNIKSVKRTTCF